MGTNYYFRKKKIDETHIDSIAERFNADLESLFEKYYTEIKTALFDMNVDDLECLERPYTYYLPNHRDLFGDIHVGKISCGWKPSLHYNEHFRSFQELQQWYEENKHDYILINEYREEIQFDDFIKKVINRNNDENNKKHDNVLGNDGYDWLSGWFS